MRRRAPSRINDVIGGLTKRWQPSTPLAELQRIWPQVAGAAVARWATPAEERAGVVTIACKDSVVAQELEFQQDSLLARIGAAGGPPVEQLRFVVRS